MKKREVLAYLKKKNKPLNPKGSEEVKLGEEDLSVRDLNEIDNS